MNTIGTQLANSGFEFFGGGSIDSAVSPTNVWNLLSLNGYTVLSDRASILNLKTSPATKVVCRNPVVDGASAMPYDIDRPAENLSLAEMTEVAIACLESDPQGFFIMVEGGKIDWACHANDAMATIGDMLDFDDAAGKAIAFYNAHPNDTLIIVTGDHETGGMTIGHATTGYTEYYSRLLDQESSYESFQANEWAVHKAANTNGYDWTQSSNLSGNADMLNLMSNKFGLVWSSLNDYQKEKLEDAYDRSMVGTNNNSSSENSYLYGSYTPVIVTITHILNERASIGWMSYSHTGVPTPVYAAGFEAYRFAGFYDNTDIAKQIAAAMRVPAALPVKK
jgi:alkaline phosphatase